MELMDRRDFLRVGAAAGLAAGLGAGAGPAARAAGAPQESAAPAGKPGRTLRAGFVGVGGRGSALLGDVLALPAVEVSVVCDLDPRNRQRALDRIEKASGKRPEGLGEGLYDYRRLLERKDLDCLVIATPCAWHATMYSDALKAGKPFYGEKPLAITARGVRSVLEAHRARPEVPVQIGFQWGAHRGRQELFRRIRAGALGELLEGRFHRQNGWDGHGGWYADRRLSGDWMLEQAVHEFNLLWSAIGAHPERAYAAGSSGVIPGRDTTNYYSAILRYPGRLVVHYSHGWIEVPGFPSSGLRMEMVGTKGAADIMGAYLQLRKAPEGGEARLSPPGGGETREHLADFFDAVRESAPSRAACGVENGAAASYIGLLIRKSMEEKREVTFQEMLDDDRAEPVPAAPA